MNVAVKALAKNEKGQALVMALILLLISGLLIAPLLAYMNTGLTAGGVYEEKAADLYAADAGVEDAVWKIQKELTGLPPPSCENPYPSTTYNVTDINGKTVEVTITSLLAVENITVSYLVESIATGNGSQTSIEAYIDGQNKYGDYSGLLDQILTSQGEINVAKKVILEYPEGAEPYPYYPGPWPEVWELEEFYGEQVAEGTRYNSNTLINIQGVDTTLGPLYVNGELDILNSSNTPATLTLNGTVYATGNTEIGQTGKDFTLYLKGQTIFISSNSTGSQPALTIGGKCTVKGPGVIIAVGDIEFKPKSQVGEEEGGGAVFILSVSGTSYLQPSGHVYGAIAGSVEVYVQQGEKPVITYPTGGFSDSDLNFLAGIKKLIFTIASWELTTRSA